MYKTIPIAIVIFTVAWPAMSATPESYAKLDKVTEAACDKASNLNSAIVGPVIRYSDRTGIDARIVDGTWPQPHMNGAKARMLCLYNRKNKRVEVQELAEPVAKVTVVKDIWWRAENIGGRSIADGSEVTMMLGSDGKIGGKSGCNGYSARYQITGNTIQVFPPMIGTRMACAPGIMSQEQTYQTFMGEAKSFTTTQEGRLVVSSASGATTTFVLK